MKMSAQWQPSRAVFTMTPTRRILQIIPEDVTCLTLDIYGSINIMLAIDTKMLHPYAEETILIVWGNIARAVTLKSIQRFRLQKQHVQITSNVAVFTTPHVR